MTCKSHVRRIWRDFAEPFWALQRNSASLSRSVQIFVTPCILRLLTDDPKTYAMCVTALWTYDYLLTLKDEVAYAWKTKNTLSKRRRDCCDSERG